MTSLVLGVLLFNYVLSQTCIIDENNDLIIPTSGCSIDQFKADLEVNTIKLAGELKINHEIKLKYNSIEPAGSTPALNFFATDFPILFEDISDKQCNNLPKTPINVQLNSNYQIIFYDILMIENQNTLTIINRKPVFVRAGDQVMINFNSGKTEYAEVKSVIDSTIVLTTDLINKHEVQLFHFYSSDLMRMFPRLSLVTQRAIKFKYSCLNLIAISDLQGVVFEDAKNLSITDNEQTKRGINLAFQASSSSLSSTSEQSAEQITIKFDELDTLLINQLSMCLNLEITQNLKNFNILNSRKLLLQIVLKEESIEQSYFFNSKIEIELYSIYYESMKFIDSTHLLNSITFINKVTYMTYRNNKLIDSQITGKFYFGWIESSFLQNSKFYLSQMTVSFFKMNKVYVNATGLEYVLKFNSDLEQTIKIIYLDEIYFYSAPNDPMQTPLITSNELVGTDSQPVAQSKDFKYLIQIQSEFANFSNRNFLNLPFKAIYLQPEKQYLIYNKEGLNQLYGEHNILRQTNLNFYPSVFYMVKEIQTISVDLGTENASYSAELSTSLGKLTLNFKERYYIISQFLIHALNLTLTSDTTNFAQTLEISIRIETSNNIQSNTIELLIIYLDSKQAIQSVSGNEGTHFSFEKSTSRRVLLNLTEIRTERDFKIVLKLCAPGEFFENSTCKVACSSGYIAFLQYCIQNFKGTPPEVPNYVYDPAESKYISCPLNCEICDTERDCKRCNIIDRHRTECANMKKGFGYNKPGPCIEGCKFCNKAYNCKQCVPGKYYDQNSYTCQMNKPICPKNCKSCISSNICDECFEGFSFNLNKCEIDCPFGYYFKDEHCISIDGFEQKIDSLNFSCLPGSYQYGSECRKFDKSFHFCDGKKCYSETICANKSMMYSLVEKSCINCDSTCLACSGTKDNCTECLAGIPFEGKCLKCSDDNCITCQTTLENCILCKAGYQIEEGKCVKCQLGYFSLQGDKICSKCDSTCRECSGTSKTCTSCNNDSQLSNNQCLIINKPQCSENCKNCPNQMCIECVSEQYEIENHQCIQKEDPKMSGNYNFWIIGSAIGSVFGILSISLYLHHRRQFKLAKNRIRGSGKVQINTEAIETDLQLQNKNDIKDNKE